MKQLKFLVFSIFVVIQFERFKRSKDAYIFKRISKRDKRYDTSGLENVVESEIFLYLIHLYDAIRTNRNHVSA